MRRSKRAQAPHESTQPSVRPSAIVATIGTIGGVSLAPLVVWLVDAIWHLQMPAEAAAAIGALIAQIANYPLLRATKR